MAKLKSKLILLLSILTVVVFIIILIPKIEKKYVYPIKYEQIIDKYSKRYNIDKYLLLAVIKTESGFNKNATSSVGARGLMQLMPDAFDWVKYKKKDLREVTFDDMYDPEYNIEYGAYYMSYLYDKYHSEKLAAAAYHAGMTQVDKWLNDKTVSDDGISINNIPSKVTGHYVNKVTDAWESYKNLYSNE